MSETATRPGTVVIAFVMFALTALVAWHVEGWVVVVAWALAALEGATFVQAFREMERRA